jgi:hypothetical protein
MPAQPLVFPHGPSNEVLVDDSENRDQPGPGWIDSSSTPAAPRLALTLRHASQTSRLEITNDLPSDFGSLTGSSRVITVEQPTSQDDQPPSLDPYYPASSLPRGCPPLCPASVLNPSRISRSRLSLPRTTAGPSCTTGRPRARDDRFPRSTPEPRPSSRHLHARHRLASQQAPARLIPEPVSIPGFDVIYGLTTRHQWIAHARLLGPHLTRSRRAFPATLTTTALDRSRVAVVCGLPLQGGRGGPRARTAGPSISDTAPHQ